MTGRVMDRFGATARQAKTAVRRVDLLSYRLWTAGALTAGVVVAAAVAGHPFLAIGAVGGAFVLMMLLVRPLLLLGALLTIGVVNLSFLTGGYKELLGGLGGIDMNGIRLIGVVAGFGTLVLVDQRLSRQLLGPWARWYLLFLIFAAGTLVASPAPIDGLRLLFKMAYPLLLFVSISALVRSEADVERLGTWTLLAAVFLVFIVNPFLVVGGGYVVDPYGQIRIQGLGQNQNPFSYYLLALSLLALSRFVFRGDRRYLLLALGLALWIIVTFSRMTLLAAVSALAAMAILGALVRRNVRPLLAALVLGLTLAIPLTPVVLERTLGFVPSPGELVRLTSDPAALVQVMHWGGRDRIWPVLVQTFRESPFVGLGIGTSARVMQTRFETTFLEVPHNEYLRLLVDTGLVGTLLFFIAIMVWLVGAARSAWSESRTAREYGLAAVGAIVAWALISLTGNPLDYYTQFTQYVALFVAGAITAASQAELAEPAVPPEPASDPDPIVGPP